MKKRVLSLLLLAAMAASLLVLPAQAAPPANRFYDLGGDAYASVESLRLMGVMDGFSDGKFYPDRTVTLGQAATILLRVLGYKDENIGGVWPDSYLSFAASIGLTDGVDTTQGNAP